MSDTAVSIEQIKDLRERTGSGIADCKKALAEAGGDMNKALEILRERGAEIARKKATRATSQGVVGTYSHGGRIGVLVEVNCETDFVARNEQFSELVHEICLQVASMYPEYVSREDVPEAELEKVTKEHILLEQPYVKDSSKSIQDLITEAVGSLGENIRISRFARFQLGEEAAAQAEGEDA